MGFFVLVYDFQDNNLSFLYKNHGQKIYIFILILQELKSKMIFRSSFNYIN